MRKPLFSPAKINLGLRIVGRRENGFHNLESLFWPVNFGDLIYLSQGSGRIYLDWEKDAPFSSAILPSEQDNVVAKVLKLIPSFSNNQDITIRKRIPLGGGLGGGSSNIGTVLKFLQENHLIEIPELAEWSAQFGADIPFFVHSQPAWVTGVGEKINILNIKFSEIQNLCFLLVFFPFGCETKRIFQEFKKRGAPFSSSYNPFAEEITTSYQISEYLGQTQNDLEPIVCDLYPTIHAVIKQLREQNCIYAGLSGSGSTCFAVFNSDEERKKTAKDLQAFFRSYNCKSISAETYTTR